MKYRVTAKYIESRAPDFYRKLTDGSIEDQEPDGREIVASMKRARITEPASFSGSKRVIAQHH